MQQLTYLKFERSENAAFISLFVECDELYFIEPVGHSWIFGYASRRAGSTVTVAVSDDVLLSGDDILQALHIAMAVNCNEAILEQSLITAGLPVKPLKRASWMQPQLPEHSEMAYRTFLSTRDLERLLSFPFQSATATFRRVLIVDATVVPEPGAGLVQPEEQPVWNYMPVYPEGVKVTPRGPVEFGGQLTITYSAPGCQSAIHRVAAGKPSPFVTYYGAAMCIQPLSRLGMELKPLSEQNSEDSEKNAKGRPVTIVMRFTDDRTLRSDIVLDPASSEYSLLRSGTWHGYRARRMVVRNHGDEVYLIDLRTNETNEVVSDQTDGQEVSVDARSHGRSHSTSPWMYVCAAMLAIILGIVVINYLPSIMPGSNPDYAPGTVESENIINAEEELMGADPQPLLAPAGAVAQDDTAKAAEPSAPGPVDAPASEGISSEDIAYLDRNTVWRRSALKSKAALELYDLFATADLRAIASNPYLANRNCANPTAVKVVQLIWEANGADTQQSNQKILQQLAGADKINLHDLHEKLARVRPTNPNRSERP